MPKKIGIYIAVFFCLLLLNFALVLKISQNFAKGRTIQRILGEIEESNELAKQFSNSSAPFFQTSIESDVQLSDSSVANLKAFFRKHNSVLYKHAEFIVKTSDKYGFDYRLLPAIAMQESTLCKAIPDGSHNCWGWGIYGDTVTKFDSFDEGIEIVAKGLKEHYLDKGLVTASAIMAKYTPSSPGSWAYGVNTFLRALE